MHNQTPAWTDPCTYKHAKQGRHIETRRGGMCVNCGAVPTTRVDDTPWREFDAARTSLRQAAVRLDDALGRGTGLTPSLLPFLVDVRNCVHTLNVKEAALASLEQAHGLPAQAR